MPPSRGLERALEEAAARGALILSARKLKEFPRAANNHDLADTTSLRTDCRTFPEICHLVALENLNLYHNCIRTIPDSIICLQSLTSLNLSRNQLCSLPSCLCNLPLRVLNASNNKLRALEEAAARGALILSARKLKEFPRAANNHDLADTVDADLSKNRLSDVPTEICHLVALENLNLYHNCIRTIPDSIICLQSLTSLNLRVLNASNNKLVNLPETIGQLHNLMELDISCNEITALPRHIGRLKALRELNVRRNLLCVLPEDLASLPLVKFDFSCNKICIKGKVHIFKYLSMEACRSEKMPDALYLPVIERINLSRTGAGSVEDMEQQRKQDSDSGVGSDNGDKRLSATEALKDQINFRDSALSTRFVNYIKGRTAADFDEPLRIEEDSHWPTEQMSKHEMIHQLKEAVELLQDPSRAEQDDVSGVQLYPVEMVNVEESLNGQDSDDGGGTPKHHDRYPGCGPPSFSSPVFGLKPRSAPPRCPARLLLPVSPPPSSRRPPPSVEIQRVTMEAFSARRETLAVLIVPAKPQES
ncbi:hypothetical protein F7725_002552 [Dissostichus mawsoni]|uniref:Uncharacterized protein n=1 Tax=Dissostichus mawsoni TaxID=36200 RepID=A0A7J5Y3P8_DISMA|nr:hypothetical protein F7725_002552 [Dissostichus mawsoni]